MRIIAAFRKEHGISYVSHLDVQRTLQRAFRRAELPLSYSKGFNPHPKLSFATALATGYTSDGEWFEVVLEEPIATEEFMERVNAALPNGMKIVTAKQADATIDTLSKGIVAAEYEVSVRFAEPVAEASVHQAVRELLQAKEIIVEKRTKGGTMPRDIRSDILEVNVLGVTEDTMQLSVLGRLTVHGGLRVETLVCALSDRLNVQATASVHRTALYFEGSELLPSLSNRKGLV